ncbi:hypothetical protein B0J17DRAFT_252531 [Rhizoctonia solani]|nr:hypothetical protein B0J17DRAFT_252531 [Rhizoctonia solani]
MVAGSKSADLSPVGRIMKPNQKPVPPRVSDKDSIRRQRQGASNDDHPGSLYGSYRPNLKTQEFESRVTPIVPTFIAPAASNFSHLSSALSDAPLSTESWKTNYQILNKRRDYQFDDISRPADGSQELYRSTAHHPHLLRSTPRQTSSIAHDMYSKHLPLLPAPRPTPRDINTLFPAQGMSFNLGGFMSASKLPIAEHLTNYGNSNSGQPPVNLKGHLSPINEKAPEFGPSFNLAAQLGMESRRLDLVWSETINQLKNKHGAKFTRARSRDISFRQKIENGTSLEDSPADKGWRAMWKLTNACWAYSEVCWMKEDSKSRTGFPGIDYRFYATHPHFKSMTVTGVDRVMSEIFSYFAAEMGKRRQNAGRTQLEELKQTEHMRMLHNGIWRLALDCESEPHCSPDNGVAGSFSTENNLVFDHLIDPDQGCTGATNVVLQSRPSFHPSSSCIAATTVDSRTIDGSLNPLLIVGDPPAPEHVHISYGRSTNKSRNDPEASAQEYMVRSQAGEQCSEARKSYRAQSRDSPNKYESKVPCTSGHQCDPPITAKEESFCSPPSFSSISTRNVPQIVSRINPPLPHAEKVTKLQHEKSDAGPTIGKRMVRAPIQHTAGFRV